MLMLYVFMALFCIVAPPLAIALIPFGIFLYLADSQSYSNYTYSELDFAKNYDPNPKVRAATKAELDYRYEAYEGDHRDNVKNRERSANIREWGE